MKTIEKRNTAKKLTESVEDVVVWMYWEGDCPKWIDLCQKTVFNHAGNNIRLIGQSDFEDMWYDRQGIDLTPLCIAHRADFIRAFLLAEYGGIWIDSDCMVVQSLAPLFKLLQEYDFIGYRERSGEVTNNFMGARKGSKIAKTYYQRVCTILRSGKELEWLTIGSKALTASINECSVPWYEIDVNLIQPVCWSKPELFFKIANEEQHKSFLNENAYCYMVSANMVKGYADGDPSKGLIHKGSFFEFLFRTSCEKNILSKIAFRENTDDDKWIIPELIEHDMYRVKDLLSTYAPRKKEYVIDCGAHIGAFSIMAAQYIENIEVIAFEPSPESFSYLSRNAGTFGKIQAYNKAVDLQDGTLNLFAPDQAEWTGRWSTLPNSNPCLTVDSIHLFSFVRSLDRPVFILKLDLQGYEEFLIEHAQEKDFLNINIIILEVQSEHFDDQKLIEYGYRLLFRPHISTHRQYVYLKGH